MKPKTPKPPKFIWADYDPSYPRELRWQVYTRKQDQRSTRPELKPIKLRVMQT